MKEEHTPCIVSALFTLTDLDGKNTDIVDKLQEMESRVRKGIRGLVKKSDIWQNRCIIIVDSKVRSELIRSKTKIATIQVFACPKGKTVLFRDFMRTTYPFLAGMEDVVKAVCEELGLAVKSTSVSVPRRHKISENTA